jgi:hypothetical protein
VDTAAPSRNFTLTVEERLRAYAEGPPAWARRRRRIEDLEAELVRRVAVAPDEELAARLAVLNDLIARHNRYYPIEANLPIDPRSGALLDRGASWRPLPPLTLAGLRNLKPE